MFNFRANRRFCVFRFLGGILTIFAQFLQFGWTKVNFATAYPWFHFITSCGTALALAGSGAEVLWTLGQLLPLGHYLLQPRFVYNKWLLDWFLCICRSGHRIQRHFRMRTVFLNDFWLVDSDWPLSDCVSSRSVLPKRGSAFYNIGVIFGFIHGLNPLLLLDFEFWFWLDDDVKVGMKFAKISRIRSYFCYMCL